MNFEDSIDFENPIDALDKFEKYLCIYEILINMWRKDINYDGYSLLRIKRAVQYSFGIEEFFEGTDAFIKSFNIYHGAKMKNAPNRDYKRQVRDRFYELSGQANSLNQTAKEIQNSEAIKTFRTMILDNIKYEWTPESKYTEWNELMRRTYDLYRESIDAFIWTKINNKMRSLRARVLRERRELNKNENA